MVGSITHTAGFCAALVAERRRAAALGVDSEVIGDVKVELWSNICVPTEIEWTRSLPRIAANTCGYFDFLGQGSLLQVPVPDGA